MITFEIPGPLRTWSGDRAVVDLDCRCATVREALDALGERWPGVVTRVVDERGKVRPHVNLFIGEENSRFLGGLDAKVDEGSVIYILPAVSGG
jgi:molybdopterin converting factor small subunit